MLDNMKQGDVIEEEGTMGELKSACESALPKVKNMLKEEEDEVKIEELEEAKSVIKGAMLKYQDIKQGTYDTKYDLSGKYRTKKEDFADKSMPTQAISLIDLDDMDSSNTSSPVQKNAYDELSDIFGEKTTMSNTNSSSPSSDLFDLLGQSSAKPTSTPASNVSSPQMNSPKSNNVIQISKLNLFVLGILLNLFVVDLHNKNGLAIQIEVYKADSIWEMKAYYSNKSTAPMDKMTLLLAAPKVKLHNTFMCIVLK